MCVNGVRGAVLLLCAPSNLLPVTEKVRTAQNVLLNNWPNYVNPTQQPLRLRVLKTVEKLNSPVRVKHQKNVVRR